jgi:hypothetical protein
VPTRRALLALPALLWLPSAVRATPADLAALFKLIGGKPERRAQFVERRHSALTRTPLESRGRLLFRAPDRLEKLTLSPVRETVRIEGGSVTIEGLPVRGVPDRRSLQLADIPLLAALVESLRATLAGDLPRLQRHYSPSLSAAADGWTLTLTPIDPVLREAVTRVLLRGRADMVSLVEIIEAGGDRTEIAITPLA